MREIQIDNDVFSAIEAEIRKRSLTITANGVLREMFDLDRPPKRPLMPQPGTAGEKILGVLREAQGPMTIAEITVATGVLRKTVSDTCWLLAQEGKLKHYARGTYVLPQFFPSTGSHTLVDGKTLPPPSETAGQKICAALLGARGSMDITAIMKATGLDRHLVSNTCFTLMRKGKLKRLSLGNYVLSQFAP